MPSFALDPDVIESLDSAGLVERRRREAKGEEQVDQQILSRSERSTGLLISDTVYFGTIYDGFTYYSNLSQVCFYIQYKYLGRTFKTRLHKPEVS